jgi:hypothetical protein
MYKISAIILAINVAINMVMEVISAKAISPLKTENAKIVEEISNSTLRGKPIMHLSIEANVCSCHVIGSQ